VTPTLHLATGGEIGTCDYYSDSQPAGATVMIIQINHPYVVTGGGTYMSRTLTKQLSWRQCGYGAMQSGRVVVTNDWGDMSSRSSA
jgi:hypothetical protein